MGIEADVLTAQNLMLWEAGMAPSSLLLLFALQLMQFRNRARTIGRMAARESLWISQKLPQSAVDISSRAWHTSWAVDVPFCWTGGLRSLTTDTMCQNLFETIGVFERQWSE
jgi:hypothetical protein